MATISNVSYANGAVRFRVTDNLGVSNDYQESRQAPAGLQGQDLQAWADGIASAFLVGLESIELAEIESDARSGIVRDKTKTKYASKANADRRIVEVAVRWMPPVDLLLLAAAFDHVDRVSNNDLLAVDGVTAQNLAAVRSRVRLVIRIMNDLQALPAPIVQ